MIGPEALAELPRASWIDVARNFVQNALRTEALALTERMYERYGDVVMQQAGAFRMVNLFGPDANRLVLLDRDQHLLRASGPGMQIMGRIFPNGLLLRDGDEHKHHRKIMHEAFTRPALRDYAERMGPMIAAGIADWGERGTAFLAFRGLQGAHARHRRVDLRRRRSRARRRSA